MRTVSECSLGTVAGCRTPLRNFRLRLRKLIPRALRRRLKHLLAKSAKPSKRRGGKGAPRSRAPGPSAGRPAGAIDFGPVRLLSAAPPVLLSGIPYGEYLGIASTFAGHYGNTKAGFVIVPTWSIEGRG